jgi:hypothetical protein
MQALVIANRNRQKLRYDSKHAPDCYDDDERHCHLRKTEAIIPGKRVNVERSMTSPQPTHGNTPLVGLANELMYSSMGSRLNFRMSKLAEIEKIPVIRRFDMPLC